MFKIILTFIFSLLLGFGSWYLIFWFLTVEPNLLLWYWWVKILYLLLSYTSSAEILEKL